MPRKFIRIPNCKCDSCEHKVYRRPYELEIAKKPYRCMKCVSKNSKLDIKCVICEKTFVQKNKQTKHCSRKCAASYKRGTRRTKHPSQNSSLRKFKILNDYFEIKNCMILGCTYNKCYDIHRFISGKLGGKYEIGNMFAICPNHHAEITRNIIKVIKVNDFLLKITEG